MRGSLGLLCMLFVSSACSPVTIDGETPDATETANLTCDEYCSRMQAVCTGPAQQYDSELACKATCEDFAKFPVGTADDTADHSIGCRLYHITVAETTARATHCTHAGETGGNECGSWCENYCHLAMSNCTGNDALYADVNACMNDCASFPDNGAPGDESGDTVQCRISWLIAAATEPPNSLVHCADGSASSTLCI